MNLEKPELLVKDKTASANSKTEQSLITNKTKEQYKLLDQAQQSLFDQLKNIRTFLLFGSGQLKGVFPKKEDFLTSIRFLLKKHPSLLRKVILHLLKNKPAIFRMLSIFPKPLTKEILDLLYQEKIKDVLLYWNDILKILPGLTKRFNRTALEDFFYYQALLYAPKTASGLFSTSKCLSFLLQELCKKENLNAVNLLHNINDHHKNGKLNSKADWNKMTPKLFELMEDQFEKNQQKEKWNMESTNDDLKDNAVYINNAGLSVIAPFLPRYFKMLDMLEDDQFKNEEMAIRGVHLLQYIATDQNETAEHFLAFNKILCGLSLSTPVPKGIELTETEEKITSEMLNAILNHWQQMGTSTIEGLRGGFIIRDGRLKWEEEGYWNLDVEKKSFDVIMKSLPWSISIINFPWLENRIQVVWT